MINVIYWSLPSFAKAILSTFKTCIEISAGIFCGAARAIGVEMFTESGVEESINLKSVSNACLNELPLKLTTEHDEVAAIMKEKSPNTIVKAKAIIKFSGVDDRCVAIFGLVCNKASELGALEILKDACANLLV